MLRIKDVMTPQAEVLSPDATTEEAASAMKTLDIGVLPVCDEEGLVGILTDRDLVVRVLAATRDPKTMLVGEAMTPSVVYCFEDDEVEHAAAIMAGQQIRRLPVLDKNRKLVGLVKLDPPYILKAGQALVRPPPRTFRPVAAVGYIGPICWSLPPQSSSGDRHV